MMLQLKGIRLTVLVVALLVLPVLARDYSYDGMSITAFVQSDSTIKVAEEWNMSFQGHYNEGYRSFYTDRVKVSGFGVWSPEKTYSVRTTRQGDSVEYSWNADVTDAEETYIFEYEFSNAFESGEKSDRLLYTVVFKDREKPVNAVSFDITFPDAVKLEELNSRSTHGQLTQTGPRSLHLEAQNIPPNTPLDVELFLPKGIVKIPEKGALDLGLWLFRLVLSAVGALAMLGIPFICIYTIINVYDSWQKYGRDPVASPVRSELLANLKPAVAGLIVDETAGIDEIIATIIDLAIRGYVQIEQKKGSLSSEVTLHLLKTDYSMLEEYEKMLVSKLFGSGRSVSMSELNEKFYKDIPDIAREVERAALEVGLFDGDPKEVRGKYMSKFMKLPGALFLAGWALFFLTFASVFLLGEPPIILFMSVFATIFLSLPIMAVAFIGANTMPRKSVAGVQMKQKYEELRAWMEKYPLKQQRLFDEFLPYAIAFKIGEVWIKKMAALGTIQRDWYSGTLTAGSFHSLHSSMSNSMTSSPRSSGGSGSGGSGFGGGGGSGGGGGGFR